MNDLDAQLASRGRNASGADGNPFRLNSVNQLFAQNGFAIETPFLDTMAQEYGANVRLLDFKAATEPSRVAINRWVEQRTEKKIQDLLAPDVLSSDTRLVLVNAIYFNAAWAKPFEESQTTSGTFHLLGGQQKSVPFMSSQEMRARAAQVNGVELFELAYDGDELSMLVMVPPAGQFQSFEQALTEPVLSGLVAGLQPEHLELKLPKFETRSSRQLAEPLSAAGLEIAFQDGADFSGITASESLAISDVVHQAFVKVNEKGTEAAAATAVVIGTTSMPTTRPVVVDRPFIFAIRDNATGALVFLGRITEP
jgi:serpin B